MATYSLITREGCAGGSGHAAVARSRAAPYLSRRGVAEGVRGYLMAMDHSRAPILEAMLEFRRNGNVVYTPPGHKQGRGADPRVLEVLGREAFLSDVLTTNGLDD